jgi:hypothetical protein
VRAARVDDVSEQLWNPHRLGRDAQLLVVLSSDPGQSRDVCIENVEIDDHQRKRLVSNECFELLVTPGRGLRTED